MKLSQLMSHVGVRPRVFGGFALVLSFLVLLAGFAMVQVERIGGTVNELVTSAAGDAGMTQARAALLEANSLVEKFIRTWMPPTLRPAVAPWTSVLLVAIRNRSAASAAAVNEAR